MIALIQKSLFRMVDGIVAAFAPVIALKHADSKWKRRVVIGIHVAFASLVLCGLVAAQIYFQLDTFVRSSSPMIRSLWLPMVGILGYSTAWSAWFVARTLRQPTEKPLFDSVTSALRDGLDRFTRAGIDPRQTPIYLILGSPAGGIREFFSSSHIDLAVLPSAEEADEPVQVCGNRDAIYVCCRDSSLVGHYARKSASSLLKTATNRCNAETRSSHDATIRQAQPAWRSGVAARTSAESAKVATPAFEVAVQSGGSNVASFGVSATATMVGDAPAAERIVSSGDTTIQRVQDTLQQIETMAVSVLQPRKSRPQEMRLDASDADALLERLETLCQEIVTLREPYCPINGVLALIPLPACDNVESSDHVGMRLERDLKTIVDSTDSQLSLQVIFCDFDLCEGSQPFLDRFPENQRHRRLGAILPAVPASESESVAASLDKATHWICNELFPPLGYRLMSRDLQDATSDRELGMGNHRIQRLIQQMRDRGDGMSRMLRRSVASMGNRLRIRGCFLAATGMAGHASKQAFCEGIVPLILDMQNEVQWSQQRRDRDRWQRSMAVAIYLTIGAAVALTTMMF
ncbi:MAG TPA: hypothetical protein DDZ51_03345 [Planctomycetaceae bacterium]|nr:hypothetical protein [Planctomycetaceae bacterium]